MRKIFLIVIGMFSRDKMFMITSIGVIIGFATLIVVLYSNKRFSVHNIVNDYIQNTKNTIQHPGEGWDFLIRAGALKLNNRGIQSVCREIEKRGYEHPFAHFPDVLRKKNFKKVLQACLERNF